MNTCRRCPSTQFLVSCERCHSYALCVMCDNAAQDGLRYIEVGEEDDDIYVCSRCAKKASKEKKTTQENNLEVR
jgi:hypothetical protein